MRIIEVWQFGQHWETHPNQLPRRSCRGPDLFGAWWHPELPQHQTCRGQYVPGCAQGQLWGNNKNNINISEMWWRTTDINIGMFLFILERCIWQMPKRHLIQEGRPTVHYPENERSEPLQPSGEHQTGLYGNQFQFQFGK